MQFLELSIRKFQREYFLYMNVCFTRFVSPSPMFIISSLQSLTIRVSLREYEGEKYPLRTVCFLYERFYQIALLVDSPSVHLHANATTSYSIHTKM